jgi:hypothetical protein
MPRKQASLHRQTARSPTAARRKVAIDGRCSIGGREAQDALVTDLGLTGCRMRANAVRVTKSDGIDLWLGETGPIASRLKWMRGGALGLSFETPLEPELLEKLCEGAQQTKVVPLRS